MGINDGAAPGKLPYDVWNNAAVIIQIESQKGCENADEIAAVEGGKSIPSTPFFALLLLHTPLHSLVFTARYDLFAALPPLSLLRSLRSLTRLSRRFDDRQR